MFFLEINILDIFVRCDKKRHLCENKFSYNHEKKTILIISKIVKILDKPWKQHRYILIS